MSPGIGRQNVMGHLNTQEKMLSNQVFAFPNFSKPFILATDASTFGIGACLSQEVNGNIKPVGYAGRVSPVLNAYSTTEQNVWL